jgi:hypothetical protein
MRATKTRGSATDRLHKKAIRKFLYYFPKGYQGQKYIEWERDYKWQAHLAWERQLGKTAFAALIKKAEYTAIAQLAVRIESKTNLLFSFEKMALRDAVKTSEGAKDFALGLYEYIYGTAPLQQRFEQFTQTLDQLPRKQTRVTTWPLHTVFGFIANPDEHIYLKPTVTKAAAVKYGFEFNYKSRPNFNTYQSLLDFAAQVRKDTQHLGPRDYIDLQSFIWVQGSEEYPD